jgi:hypothetical protein
MRRKRAKTNPVKRFEFDLVGQVRSLHTVQAESINESHQSILKIRAIVRTVCMCILNQPADLRVPRISVVPKWAGLRAEDASDVTLKNRTSIGQLKLRAILVDGERLEML